MSARANTTSARARTSSKKKRIEGWFERRVIMHSRKHRGAKKDVESQAYGRRKAKPAGRGSKSDAVARLGRRMIDEPLGKGRFDFEPGLEGLLGRPEDKLDPVPPDERPTLEVVVPSPEARSAPMPSLLSVVDSEADALERMLMSPMARIARALRKRWRIAAVALLMTTLASIVMWRMRWSEDTESPEAEAGVLVDAHEALRGNGTGRA
jgi:hypothetical protein